MTVAVALYQANLDDVSQRLWARDFDGVMEFLEVPTHIEMKDGTATLLDRDALMRHLTTYRDFLEEVGAEGYHRLCIAAEMTDPDCIAGRHRTYILRGGRHLIPPYECEMRLRRSAGLWRAAGLRVQARNAELRVVAPGDLEGGT